MIIEEAVPIASLTTFRVGGPARFVCECRTEDDVVEAIRFAEERTLPWRVLGEGSNVLARDEGFDGVLLRMCIDGIVAVERDSSSFVTAGAGVSWDALVRYATERGLWGIENLAGIPGTVGAAPVQNIGAYGAEAKDTITEVRVYDAERKEVRVVKGDECDFGYRESRFKREPSLVILSVTFALTHEGTPSLGYKDFGSAREAGVALATPTDIAAAVRGIRARKFPDLCEYGTAGSFFKNPFITPLAYERLIAQYPDLPGFPGEEGVKIPIAYILDHVLKTRGYAEGNVGFFENHSLILISMHGATCQEINAFAKKFERRIFDVSGIKIEREVQMFP